MPCIRSLTSRWRAKAHGYTVTVWCITLSSSIACIAENSLPGKCASVIDSRSCRAWCKDNVESFITVVSNQQSVCNMNFVMKSTVDMF